MNVNEDSLVVTDWSCTRLEELFLFLIVLLFLRWHACTCGCFEAFVLTTRRHRRFALIEWVPSICIFRKNPSGVNLVHLECSVLGHLRHLWLDVGPFSNTWTFLWLLRYFLVVAFHDVDACGVVRARASKTVDHGLFLVSYLRFYSLGALRSYTLTTEVLG
jgi:hypothetical protein